MELDYKSVNLDPCYGVRQIHFKHTHENFALTMVGSAYKDDPVFPAKDHQTQHSKWRHLILTSQQQLSQTHFPSTAFSPLAFYRPCTASNKSSKRRLAHAYQPISGPQQHASVSEMRSFCGETRKHFVFLFSFFFFESNFFLFFKKIIKIIVTMFFPRKKCTYTSFVLPVKIPKRIGLAFSPTSVYGELSTAMLFYFCSGVKFRELYVL